MAKCFAHRQTRDPTIARRPIDVGLIKSVGLPVCRSFRPEPKTRPTPVSTPALILPTEFPRISYRGCRHGDNTSNHSRGNYTGLSGRVAGTGVLFNYLILPTLFLISFTFLLNVPSIQPVPARSRPGARHIAAGMHQVTSRR